MISNLVKVVLAVPYLFVLNIILRDYFEKQIKDKGFLIANTVAASLIITSFLVDIDIGVFKIILLLLYLCVLAFYYSSGNLLKTALAVLGLFVAINVGELIAALIISNIFKLNVAELKNDMSTMVAGSLLSLMATLFFAKIIRGKKFFDSIIYGFDEKQTRSIYVFIGMTGVVIFGNLMVLQSLMEEHSSIALLFLVVVLVLYVAFIVVFINVNRNLSKKTEEYNQLKFYTEIIENLVESSNKFRHDYRNIMLTFDGYLRNNEIEQLKKYYQSIVQIASEKTDNSFYQLKNIKDPGIKGLLTTKLNEIATKNIRLDFEAKTLIDIKMDMLDFSRILGVFIDNAGEAAKLAEDQHIRMGFVEYEKSLVFLIANTYFEKPDLKIIFNSGASSKGENRGIGLANVREIIDSKYENVSLNTYLRDGYFIQELTMEK